jgi:hypothetical protein
MRLTDKEAKENSSDEFRFGGKYGAYAGMKASSIIEDNDWSDKYNNELLRLLMRFYNMGRAFAQREIVETIEESQCD